MARISFSRMLPALAVVCSVLSFPVLAEHPNLVITSQSVADMRSAISQPGRFTDAFEALQQQVDKTMSMPVTVPVPKDGGGGYTHERHKKNYQQMYNAGLVYQLSEDKKYADYVGSMLEAYAELYPTLDVHPKRKENAQNPGKLFWQSLNEAMWLVYTIQAYDMVYDALAEDKRRMIESQLLKPVALFLSEGQPSTFNKVHNHGTWATAGVGMAGYVMDEPEWVEKALLDLDKSGKGGFLKQLDKLFSPQGYYNEGPYYQRFALLPFVTFAKAIENNDPERHIFAHRDGVLLKAIDTTIQLSYNGLFFPLNDAIKSKGIDTIELVHGVTVAYGLTEDPGLLDIAQKQDRIILSGDGLKVANALDKGLAEPYEFKSVAYGDGSDGTQGALVVMRGQQEIDQAVVFKPASQGLGHGHFDKLTWQFYDKGAEIVSDYGAARFLNVEAKYGGRYLPENETYAKQTVAHNTVVVDEASHFNGNVKTGNANAPTLHFFETSEKGSIARASIDTAYQDVSLDRTMALINLPGMNQSLLLDIFSVDAEQPHQLDLPLHYKGQLIETSFELQTNTQTLHTVSDKNGYQHLWLTGQGTPERGLAKVSWLNDNGRFYTQTSLANADEEFLFTQLGAGDPNYNLRQESGFIRRVSQAKKHQFVAVLEPHGEYNPSEEYTLNASSQLSALSIEQKDTLTLVSLTFAGQDFVVAINSEQAPAPVTFTFKDTSYTARQHLEVFAVGHHQE